MPSTVRSTGLAICADALHAAVAPRSGDGAGFFHGACPHGSALNSANRAPTTRFTASIAGASSVYGAISSFCFAKLSSIPRRHASRTSVLGVPRTNFA